MEAQEPRPHGVHLAQARLTCHDGAPSATMHVAQS